jgi:Flp pilus assembly protein TadD
MKNKILSACVLALSLAACNEPKQQPPVFTAKSSMKPEPMPEMSFIVDAGQMSQAETVPQEIDVLGVEHDHRGKVNHLAKAKELKTQGDAEGALAEARKAIFDSPADEDVLSFIGKVARSTGEKELAAAAYGRLATIRTDDAMPLVQQARVLLSMRDLEGAVKAGQEAITRDPENPEAFQVVGRAYLSDGELQAAIGMFEKVVELNPDHGYALNNLGFACLRANENDKAVEALTRATELLPNVAYIHNNLGVALERTGDAEGAKLAYAKSTSLSPKYVKAKINAERVAKAAATPDVGQAEDTGGDEQPGTPEIEMPEE